VAAANVSDPDHAACAELLRSESAPLVVSPLVLAEACYLIGRFGTPANEATFLRSVAHGPFHLEALTPSDLESMAGLVVKYADLRLGAADASVVVLAERLGLRRLATLDRRHFSVVRPAHADAFELLPEPSRTRAR